jgi:hypothetical protein
VIGSCAELDPPAARRHPDSGAALRDALVEAMRPLMVSDRLAGQSGLISSTASQPASNTVFGVSFEEMSVDSANLEHRFEESLAERAAP